MFTAYLFLSAQTAIFVVLVDRALALYSYSVFPEVATAYAGSEKIGI
jgi:hypothetical protein